MNQSILGTSNLRVSQISFGCMSLGNNHEENKTLLHQAFDGGINFFDTADIYQNGFNEETLGLAFKGIREKIILSTKVGNQIKSDGSGLHWNASKNYILTAVEKSLKRLQTDYIDLYQLHGGTLDDPIDETIEAFELLKRQGKIRHFGISSIRPNVIREYIKRSNLVSVMMQYSLLDRRPEEECLPLLQQHNIGVLVRGSLASGLLINKPAKAYLKYTEQEVAQTLEAISTIVQTKHTNTQAALGFVFHHPAISSCVVGVRSIEQLHDVLQSIKHIDFTAEEFEMLQNVLPSNVYEQHR